MPEEITLFAETNYRGQRRRFGIKKDDRRRHMYIIGKTGMGKTTMLEHMVYADIMAGNGLAVVDPHGDFAEKILDYIPSSRINDVIYFNPADIEWPIAFNVMEKVDPKDMPLVSSGLIGVFKKIYAESWGPRLEYVLRNAVLALLEYPGSTLLGVPRILVDKTYRQKVIKKITDPVVKSFWVDEFSRYPDKFQTEAIAPIQNKIGQFLSNPLVRNIVSQTKSSIDLRKIMDEQKILIINLAKGRIGEDYSALLGAMMVTKLQLAAMSRVDIPEPERKDFYLYVDEFQNFATESFANILSEARKYRLNLVIAHQYIGQLVTDQSTVVRDAVFGNVGTIITFRIGAADAEFLEKEFEPVFMMNDLVNLPKYHVYLKLMIDGVASDAFSAITLYPLGDKERQRNAEKIIKNSRQRYAIPRNVIEEKILKWSGMENETGDGSEKKNNGGDKGNRAFGTGAFARDTFRLKRAPFAAEDSPALGAAKSAPERKATGIPKGAGASAEGDKRVWHDAVCQRCLRTIQVPFKPDPARKTYCRECLKLVRTALAKEEGAPGRSVFQKETPGAGETAAQNFISLDEAMRTKPVSFSAKKRVLSDKERSAPQEQKTDAAVKTKKIPSSGTIKPKEKVRFE